MRTYTDQFRRRGTMLFAVAILGLSVGQSRAALVTHTHRFDFEPTAGPTEPGWTHIEPSTLGGPATLGFMPTPGAGRNSVDRGSSTQVPILVTRDNI